MITTILDEMKEFALSEKRRDDKEHTELLELSRNVKNILEKLPPEQAEIINTYITKTAVEADEDCRYLYMQGAKDCIKALKRLEVI